MQRCRFLALTLGGRVPTSACRRGTSGRGSPSAASQTPSIANPEDTPGPIGQYELIPVWELHQVAGADGSCARPAPAVSPSPTSRLPAPAISLAFRSLAFREVRLARFSSRRTASAFRGSGTRCRSRSCPVSTEKT